ncbi:MAG: hypothetical protein ABR562_01230 [Thermoplasmatota archaeon]
MQEGIGRSGYRLLSSVFLGIGVLGLVTTLYAFEQGTGPRGLFDWLGFGLSFVALVALYALALTILLKPAALASEPSAAPSPAGRSLDFEFQPPPMPETGPEVAIPIPAAKPLVVQPNRNIGRDAKGWPRRQPPSGLTMGEKRDLQVQAVEMLTAGKSSASEIEFEATPPRPRNGHTPGLPAVMERDMAVRVERAVVARVAGPNDDPEWNPEGTTKGKCGGCGAMLYAPPQRPIHLRCPKCDKVTLLR